MLWDAMGMLIGVLSECYQVARRRWNYVRSSAVVPLLCMRSYVSIVLSYFHCSIVTVSIIL